MPGPIRTGSGRRRRRDGSPPPRQPARRAARARLRATRSRPSAIARCSPSPARIGCRGSTRSRRRRSRASRRARAPSCWSSTRTDTSSTRHPSSTTARRPGSSSIAATPRVCCRGCARCASACGSTRATRATSTRSSAARAPRSTVSPLQRPLVCRWCGSIRGRGSRPAGTRMRRWSRTRAPDATGPRRSSRAPRRSASRMPPPRATSRSPASSPPMRCASPHGARAGRTRSTSARCRTSSTGCAPPCTSSKGCYRGQETVAKVHNLGHPPRRLVALQLDGSDSVLPSHGAAVFARRGRRRRRHLGGAATSKRDRSRSRSCGGPPPSTPRSWSARRTAISRGAGGHRPPGGRGDRERPPPAAPRSTSRLSAPWARPRSRPRRPSSPAGARASTRDAASGACRSPRSRSCRSWSPRPAPTPSRTTSSGIRRRCSPRP